MKETKEIMWSIHIKSSANTKGLTNKELEDAIFSIKSEHSRTNKKNFYDKTREQYKGTVGEWQMNKSEEVEKNFIEGLSVNFNDNVVTIETKFEMTFPEDWDRSDVNSWVEGFHRLTIEYLELSMKKIVSLHKSGQTFDDKKNELILSVLTDIEKNQNWNIKKINKM
jgi:hypothetical protein